MALLDLDSVRVSFIGVVAPLLTAGVPFLKSEQNAPRPTNRPYLTFKILPPIQVGRVDQAKFDSVTGNQTNRTLNQIDIIVFGYGEGSHNELNKLRFQFNKNSVVEDLSTQNLGFRDITELKDTTVFLDEKWEERGSFVVSLYAINEDVDAVGTIETVNVDAQVTDAEDNVVLDETITIS